MIGCLHVKDGNYFLEIDCDGTNNHKNQKFILSPISDDNYQAQTRNNLQDILFCDFISQWMNIIKSVVRPNTFVAYQCNVNKHIIPYFSKLGVSLKNLQPLDLQKFYSIKLNEGLSPNTILKIHTNIHKCLKYAMVTINLITFNPADRVILPRKQRFIGKYFDADQLQSLFFAVKGDPIEPAVVLAATYGLRRSEVLGLKWDAVSFEKNTLIIRHAAIEADHKVIYTDQVKNQSSYRTLPLMPHIKNYLYNLKTYQNKMKLLLGAEYVNNDYICKWENGKPLKPNYISQRFRKVLENSGFPLIRFHDLRHSSASLLLSLGFSLKDIQEWLGHADIATTSNIYAHLQYKQKITMANQIDNELYNLKKINNDK
ncbi:MAG: site-specific integrase [Ruminococcaceae bacterium]|nr:site-specific integrase [Oscillospiraceae bacterium]